MKPSIFIMSKYKLINLNEFSNNQHYLDILDKRFIDREELKEKINDIDIWHKNGLQLKKEILELLK